MPSLLDVCGEDNDNNEDTSETMTCQVAQEAPLGTTMTLVHLAMKQFLRPLLR